MGANRTIGTEREAAEHAERHAGSGNDFPDQPPDHAREALSPVLGVAAQALPAVLHVAAIRLDEARRGLNLSISE
ncbi:hypothetical protein D3C80_1901840 [compost metagenome]